MSETSPDQRQAIRDLPEGPIQVLVFDLDGVPRGKLLAKEKVLAALEDGLGMCNVVFGWDSGDATYDNTQATGWHTGYPDAEIRIYPDTLRRMPWQGDLPLLICDFDGGELADICPRTALRRVLAKAAALDIEVMSAIEYEWFNFRDSPHTLAEDRGQPPMPITPGMHGYSLLRPATNWAFYRELWEGMAAFRVPLEGLHTETGPGVYEAAPKFTSAAEAADRAALFKLGTKHIGIKHGVVASFMAKWREDLPGCGGHLHQSLRSLSSGANLGFDASRPFKLSKTFAHYLAGQLHALPLLLPLLAPNVNSYKRLVPGSWAATGVGWGIDNRTAALRLIGKTPAAFRIEHRVPGADANPHLVMAATIAAGLYGIEHELPLSMEPIGGNAYQQQLEPLPRDLGAALAKMEESRQLAQELLGEPFIDHFMRTRHWEWRQYGQAVTDWERRRYLEII